MKKLLVVRREIDKDVDLILSNFNDILNILKERYPYVGRYGKECGRTETLEIFRALQNKDLIARIARELRQIDITYSVASDKHFEAIEVAVKNRTAARKKLIESIS